MTITADMVRKLREITDAPMMDCKRALEETHGDMDAAVTKMREKGLAKAAKRASRVAAEGTLAIHLGHDAKRGVMVEVNSETDFVGRDQNLRKFAENIAKIGLEHKVKDVPALMSLNYQSNHNVEQVRAELVAKLGENIQVRRIAMLESPGIVNYYKHGDRIGVMVAIDKPNAELAKDLAMHIAAIKPMAIDESGVSKDLIKNEREIYMAQAKDSGKPADIVEKMVLGRINKFLKEVCLLTQPFVKNPDQSVADLLKTHQAKVLGFIRFEVGEGIEKESVDFAAEVKAQVKGG